MSVGEHGVHTVIRTELTRLRNFYTDRVRTTFIVKKAFGEEARFLAVKRGAEWLGDEMSVPHVE